MKRLLVILLVLNFVFAGKVGLVVQFNDNEVMTKCITISIDNSVQPGCSVNPATWCNENTGSSTAEKVLRSSGLKLVLADEYIAFPGCSYGRLLCRIENVGCEASGSSCVGCGSNYWGFFYLKDGGWQYSECGVSGFNVKNGDVLGFRWGGYGDLPAVYSFNEICASPSQSGEVQPLKKLSIEIQGNCTEQPVVIKVKEEGGEVIWEPTNFVFPSRSGLNIILETGVGVEVLRKEVYFGKDAGYDKVAFLFTDENGIASFTSEKTGNYKLQFRKDGFIDEEREVEVNECVKEVITPAEETKFVGEEKPATRVQIIAPKTAVVNTTVVLRVVSEEGKPLPFESVFVKFSGGEKQLITNESGEASFTAEEEGVYNYYSPTHLLTSYEVTNIMKETPPIAFQETPEKEIEQPPSVGMATAGPSPLLFAGGAIIILVLLYLFREVRK
ncbi:MAG: hypothetical protein QXF56_04180 [Candidatus Micrarchaeia archaeon]